MALPREPRQKMINMMYLVLTALLALNVSSEILNAFKTVNNSLEKTNTVVNASTTDILTSLRAKLNDAGTAEKAKIWVPKADLASNYAKAVDTYIQGLKDQILKKAGADYANGDSSYKEDNLDITTRMMVDKGEGKILFNNLKKYQNDLFAIDPRIKDLSLPIDLGMPKTQNKSNKSWEAAYFHMVPTVAALTILSKFQNDVKVSENKVVAFCHEQVGKVEFRFNQYEAIVGQNSKVLLPGQDLEITAGLAAMNSDKKPTVTIGGKVIALDAKGMAVWKNAVNSSGKIPVNVSFINQDGKTEERKFDVEYTVGQSNAAVQLDKMNVLFIGVDNPITISGSGSVDQLRVSASGGGAVLSGSGGHRSVRVSQETDNCTISVTTIDGKTTPVRFRVRSIPDPTPYIGTVKSGDMAAGAFKSQAGVRAIVDNFFYETQFNVVSFRMTGDGDGFTEGVEEKNNTGAAWNEARSIINKCRPGSFVTIEDIRAIGPDGRTRKLTPMIFNLK
jgi:gliding motility-associated protein GldM